MTATVIPARVRAHRPLRVLGVELLDELRGIGREPAALFFSVLMPVGFYALFASLFDGYRQLGACRSLR
jgi:ABC-2 type transport system permease protein